MPSARRKVQLKSRDQVFQAPVSRRPPRRRRALLAAAIPVAVAPAAACAPVAPGPDGDDAVSHCVQTDRSYDPRSGTNDGYRHPCPSPSNPALHEASM
jgi:hypothetical protein